MVGKNDLKKLERNNVTIALNLFFLSGKKKKKKKKKIPVNVSKHNLDCKKLFF